VDAGIRNSLSMLAQSVVEARPRARFRRGVAVRATPHNQLTGRRPSAICSRRVGRAYTSACCVPRSGLASLHGSHVWSSGAEALGGCAGASRSRGASALPAQARGGCLFSFRARYLPRLGTSAGCNGGWGHVAVTRSIGRLRRWSGLGSRAELHRHSRRPGARFDVGVSPRRSTVARSQRRDARGPTSCLKVCLGGCASRGGEWGLQLGPTVAPVFRPRSRGGSCECPFWLGRRERHVGPGRTAPKTGRGSAGWTGGEPGTARDTRTDGLAEMTRSMWRLGEPPKVSSFSGRLRPDSRVVLAVRRFPRFGRSSFSATTLPPTDSRAALSLGHAQHVGHQCRYR
jgi:hypothetical protein